MYKKFICRVAAGRRYPHLLIVLFVVTLACFGCSPRVSYSIRTLHIDPWFSGRNLSNVAIALCPFLSANGSVTTEELESEKMAVMIQDSRRDLKFASYSEFEDGFPARFDRREIAEFYKAVFSEEILSVKGMDSIWKYARQPYILAFSLIDGASIRNMDSTVFKQVSVRCDLWSRDSREVVWRSVCKGVSDDRNVDDRHLIIESMRLLTENIPQTLPNYGQESW